MKKIILIGSNSIHTYNYYKLIENYFNEIIIVTDIGSRNYFEKEKDKIYYIKFSLKNILKFVKSIFILKKLIENNKPDVIHVHQANKNALMTVITNKKIKIPIILTAWGSDILVIPKRNIFLKKMVKYILNNVTLCTSDSLYMKYEIKNLLKKDLNIKIINFGVPSNLLNSVKIKKNIIYSNRLHKDLYQIDKIILLFSEFIKKYNDWNLIIAGEGKETEKLKRMVLDLGITNKVEFVGWLDKDQNYYYYEISKIYISIPKSDATSISLLEAMASGCIPVVSNIPANLEWIIDGYNGLILDDININKFEKIISMDWEIIQKINKEIIKNKALNDSSKKQFTEIYKNL